MTKRQDFHIDGYSIEYHERSESTLIVTFPSAANSRAQSPKDEKAWGQSFVAKRGFSALHFKTNLNCWFRRPQLLDQVKRLQDLGLFDRYKKIVTYGGSMGGYGALAYAGSCRATHVLALNPQVQLGPTVRNWEKRFIGADKQDWTGSNLNITESLSSVQHLITVHDPWHEGDSRHISMISHPHIQSLHVPFVGHRIPQHLQKLGVLAWLFDRAVEDHPIPGEFYQKIRNRRNLGVWQKIMLERADENLCRKNIILHHFPRAGDNKAEEVDE